MLGGKLIERKKLNSDLGALVDGWCWFLLYDSVETIFVIFVTSGKLKSGRGYLMNAVV